MKTEVKKLSYLILLESYQNEEVLESHYYNIRKDLVGFIEFLKLNKSESLNKICNLIIRYCEENLDTEEIYETIGDILSSLKLPIEDEVSDLILQCFTEYVLFDSSLYESIGKYVNEFFVYQGEPSDLYYWRYSSLDGEPETPEIALSWCKEFWPSLWWPDKINIID